MAITSTYVVISDTTNSSGEVSITRPFPTSQPTTGRVRKADSEPYYKPNIVSGTISTTAGITINTIMRQD